MKEFARSKKITYNLMSFTAFKSLLLFSFLVESPKSIDEMREYIINHPYLKKQEKLSSDAVRIYMYSLEKIGCQIVKTRENKVTKFSIAKTPFKMKVSEDQFNDLMKTYKHLSKVLSVHELIIVEKFLRKIIKHIDCENAAEIMEKKSVLKGIDPDLLTELTDHAEAQNQIIIEYNSPHSGQILVELIAQRVEYTNNMFYIYGTSIEHQNYGCFLVNRIIKIASVKPKAIAGNLEEITVGLELTGSDIPEPDGCVKILNTENGKTLLEITSSNTFDITQRLLAMGGDCKVLYPQEFKAEFVKKLKQMRQQYE